MSRKLADLSTNKPKPKSRAPKAEPPKATKAETTNDAPAFELKNYYNHVKLGKEYRQNDNPMAIQHPSMNLIVGGSGTGKTGFVLLNLLLNEKTRLMWDKLYVFAKISDEPIYQLLQNHCNEIQEKFEEESNEPLGYDLLTISEDLSTLPDRAELQSLIDRDLQTVIIFDDMLFADKASLQKVAEYYTFVRKMNCSCFFLAQNNTQVNRIIRENSHNVILMYPSQAKQTSIIASDYRCELPKATFIKMLQSVTKGTIKKKNCLLIDMVTPDTKKKFRHNILTPIDVTAYMTDEEKKDWNSLNGKVDESC